MVQSLNQEVVYVTKATSFLGMADYGKILLGNAAFEFYDDRNPANFIQIPWEEIDYVVVSILFSGRWIPRFAIQTQKAGSFSFAAKDTKALLRQVRHYVPADRIVRSLSFFEVVKRALLSWRKKP
ncbi:MULTISPECIES: DUF956 family protein [Aerococcus]|uniref:DUF956 family protein n=1 Tax=Aerococcus sanguinicola TaxID=119206 RepID=A0A5N1GJX1_9LACT|nr:MULTISPECIES: DUF956 family protein [Aerococcus]KAA9301285.1 DUF956 family protein [Aerococcus sanguinicola]MDK6370080.1 DUF956 family protein [Aerococcus sp. UMB9870]MDK6680655.1 DUF956 family protein [Aerococcus sp. UMB8608]MDK6687478.1 DUF956 family protein [Aerococcus sp. UMB8623]MDK6940605.1 DUF956 family protein [Aerococcus sp. UMB8487]